MLEYPEQWNVEKMVMTEKEIQRIKQRNKGWGSAVPLKTCDCKGEKIIKSAYPRGAGHVEIIVEIMCMDCGKTFEGFVDEMSDKIFIGHKILEIKGME